VPGVLESYETGGRLIISAAEDPATALRTFGEAMRGHIRTDRMGVPPFDVDEIPDEVDLYLPAKKAAKGLLEYAKFVDTGDARDDPGSVVKLQRRSPPGWNT